MVDPVIDEVAELMVEVEEQMVALVVDMKEDLAMLFGNDDFSDDDFKGFEDDEEVWELNEEWLTAPVTLPLMPDIPTPSTYKVGGPSTVAVKGHSFALLMVQVVGKLEQVGTLVEQGQQAATQQDETIEGLSQQDACIRHLEIIMIGCTGLGIEDYNSLECATPNIVIIIMARKDYDYP
uniref:Uncharacterized protein n=1 Tax=Tanacetum cinerariifolium TaxID=118510 RepID=A0A6L2K048_TANCI|nr:hypothetical protein [Tanacetum cinerariifolium]